MFLEKVLFFPNFFIANNRWGINRKWAWRQYKNLSPFQRSVIFVAFHLYYLPLAAAVNQNLKVIVRKEINLENREFKRISFADDLTCFLHTKKPDDVQFLPCCSHTYDECSGLKHAEAGEKRSPFL